MKKKVMKKWFSEKEEKGRRMRCYGGRK